MGQLTTNEIIAKKQLDEIIGDVKQQLSDLFGKQFQFGFFYNPEIGSLFIASHLTPTFLDKVEEKEIASLTVGLSGIFRGLGFDMEDINSYLSELKNNSYFLIIRGESSALASIESMLNV